MKTGEERKNGNLDGDIQLNNLNIIDIQEEGSEVAARARSRNEV